jgi:hypothetical protein
MSSDKLQQIQPLHTVTATEITGPFVVLPGPMSGDRTYNKYEVRIQYQDAILTADSGNVTFASQISYDRGATWVLTTSSDAITLTSTAGAGSLCFPVIPNKPTDAGEIWLQVLAVIDGTPTNPIISYDAILLS